MQADLCAFCMRGTSLRAGSRLREAQGCMHTPPKILKPGPHILSESTMRRCVTGWLPLTVLPQPL